MADREQSSAATLGTVLSWIGYAWVVFSVLWGMGAVQTLGVSGRIATAVGTTILPAIVLIGVGRVIRRRARAVEDSTLSNPSPAPLRTPPVVPQPDVSFEFPPPMAPKPTRTVSPPKKAVDKPAEVLTGPESMEETSLTQELESATKPAGRPKTSQELIEEARKRWGTRP